MSPGGHLFLRGASDLALLPHRGGGEERGGEKRLDEQRSSQRCEEERKELLRCRAGNRLHAGELLGGLVGSSSHFGIEACFPALEGNGFTLLSSKDAPTCVSRENVPFLRRHVDTFIHASRSHLFLSIRTCHSMGACAFVLPVFLLVTS